MWHSDLRQNNTKQTNPWLELWAPDTTTMRYLDALLWHACIRGHSQNTNMRLSLALCRLSLLAYKLG